MRQEKAVESADNTLDGRHGTDAAGVIFTVQGYDTMACDFAQALPARLFSYDVGERNGDLDCLS